MTAKDIAANNKIIKMAMFRFIVCVAIIAASVRDVKALADDDMKIIYEKLLPHITECSQNHGLSEGELKEAKNDGNLASIDSCFFSCVLKKAGLMSEDGMFDAEKTLEKSKEYLKEEEDLKLAAAAVEECSAVNSEDVTDGDAGCERAKKLVECLSKHKEKFFKHSN